LIQAPHPPLSPPHTHTRLTTPTPHPTTGEARSAGSTLPGPGQPQNNPVRMLRGDAPLPSPEEFKQYSAPEKPILLAPGMYLMPDGAKTVEEVQAMAEPAH
jgi:hypothetical protein